MSQTLCELVVELQSPYQTRHRIGISTIDIRRIGYTIRLWVYSDYVLRHEEAPIAILEPSEVSRVTSTRRIVCAVSGRCDVVWVEYKIACGRIDGSGGVCVSKITVNGALIVDVCVAGELEWQIAGRTSQYHVCLDE